MLFAWQCIMHQMIHKLLSLFYHLQRINNGTLASCFFSICHCSLSNSVCADWLAQFCPCCMSPQKSTLNQTLWALYFIAVDLLPVTTCRDRKMGFHYREVSGEYPLPPMLAGFPRQLLHTIFHIWSNLVTPETHKVAFFFFSLLFFFFFFFSLNLIHSFLPYTAPVVNHWPVDFCWPLVNWWEGLGYSPLFDHSLGLTSSE